MGTTAASVDWNEWQTLLQLRATPAIWERLNQLQGSELQVQSQLRKEFSQDLVRAAVTLQGLRRKAESKFARGAEMWFDRVGLEQCTTEVVAAHKAQRFQGLVWDFCTGIGSDAIALARHGCDVVTVDADPLCSLRARWNAELLVAECLPQFISARVEEMSDRSGLLHVDPDRRAGSHSRAVRLEDYVPSLDQMQQWMSEFRGGGIKLSPAANFSGKFSRSEIELISVHGECKEATVWFGELAGSHGWRATALPSGETLSADPLDEVADQQGLQRYLFDPDPAIVRSGLVDVLAVRLGLARLDPAEEYLTGEQPVESAFVRAFEVVAELSNNPKEIRAYFRASRIGQLEIKCRHIPVDVERFRKQLTLPGDQPAVLIIARIQGKARAVVARRVTVDGLKGSA